MNRIKNTQIYEAENLGRNLTYIKLPLLLQLLLLLLLLVLLRRQEQHITRSSATKTDIRRATGDILQ